MKSLLRKIGWLIGLLILFGIGFGARYAILDANRRAVGGDLPFTLESALQFRAVEQLYQEGHLPPFDPAIQVPDGVRVFETDTVMAEYFYAWMAHVLPNDIPLSTRVRWLTMLWFSLCVPLMAIWVTGWTRSKGAGAVAALFYAFSLASVIRSSGLELSRENFALPFLIAHLALDAWTARASRDKTLWLRGLASGLALAFAMMAWDMIQFYLLLWAGYWLVRFVRTQRPLAMADRARYWGPVCGLLLAGLLNPYLRSHLFLRSLPLFLIYGGLVLHAWRGRHEAPRWQRGLLGLLPLILYAAFTWGGGEEYRHFHELLWAKLRYLNVKPADPALLTFSQRIMWVPALDSATWPLTAILFPATLLLIVLGFLFVHLPRILCGIKLGDHHERFFIQIVYFFCASLLTYILFVRFHVYVAIFGAALLGEFAWHVHSGRGWGRWIMGPALTLGVLLEASHVLKDPGQWGRPNVYYKEVKELTDWLKEHVAPEPVLANFGVSGSILAYGECPIVLHPKFESQAIRDRVEAYGTLLFKGTERAFRDWADEHGAHYYVYALGEFAQQHPELQMRYFVNALNPPADAPARVFEERPEEAVYFESLWGNRKYRVFRIIGQADENKAHELTLFAEQAFQRGELDRAAELAWAALALFPAQYRAREVIRHTTSLKEQGFEIRNAEHE